MKKGILLLLLFSLRLFSYSRYNGGSNDGNANVLHWPGNAAQNTFESLPAGPVTFNTGIICKGGSFTHGAVVTSISDRFDASTSPNCYTYTI